MPGEHRSMEVNELFSSLSKAQAEFKVAVKDSSNPFFKSKYATLQSIIEASRPALCKQGLSVVQQVIPHENGYEYLVTMLCHSSGQWLSSSMKIAPTKPDVQSLGSYITYLRRYSYSSLIGVYDGAEDDDGNGATLGRKPESSDNHPATESQMKRIVTLTNKNPEYFRDVIESLNIGTSRLNYRTANKVIEALNAKYKEHNERQETLLQTKPPK